jgi:hypothetical protein
MPRSSAEELVIESRRTRVAALFLQGVKRQGELAQRLGVDRSTVSRDLKVLNARWKEAAVRDLDAAKGQELERLDLLESEYWQAWEKSKQAHEVATTEQTTGGAGERVKEALRSEEQTGDPRYLAGVERCIEQRCKLLGLNAPTETRLTGKDGGPIQHETQATVDWSLASVEELRCLRDLQQRLAQRAAGPAQCNGD